MDVWFPAPDGRPFFFYTASRRVFYFSLSAAAEQSTRFFVQNRCRGSRGIFRSSGACGPIGGGHTAVRIAFYSIPFQGCTCCCCTAVPHAVSALFLQSAYIFEPSKVDSPCCQYAIQQQYMIYLVSVLPFRLFCGLQST